MIHGIVMALHEATKQEHEAMAEKIVVAAKEHHDNTTKDLELLQESMQVLKEVMSHTAVGPWGRGAVGPWGREVAGP